MIAKLKLAAYVILCALAIWYGHKFYSSYSNMGQRNATAPVVPAKAFLPTPVPTNPAPVDASTNASSTNSDSTNTLAGTNSVGASNVVQQPPPPLATNTVASNPPPAADDTSTAGSGMITAAAGQGGKSVKFLAAFVLSLIGLGILIAYDVSQFMGARAVDYLFNDDGEGNRDPEYERAEQAWVNGKPLEAIEMMREYLKKNPREQYVALRIAEIYEKDLRNYVAASLEYEEVLRKRLPAERWGWAAVHLCNIYGKLGKNDQRKELLERIVRDYPKTAAAKKARRNLGLPEMAEEPVAPAPVAKPEAAPEGQEREVYDLDEVIATPEEPAAEPEPAPEAAAPEMPKSNLPPGFRKKK